MQRLVAIFSEKVFSIFLIGYFLGCTPKNISDESISINVRVPSFPSSINYLNSSSSFSSQIQHFTTNKLLRVNHKLGIDPWLVYDEPNFIRRDSLWLLQFELRPEARWDDGSPVTAEDVAFSLKVLKLPFQKVTTSFFLQRLSDLDFDSSDLKKFVITGKGNKDALRILVSDFSVFQKAKFDPEGSLDHISMSDISNNPESIRQDSLAKAFVHKITSDPFRFEGEYFNSSGPYKISSIEDGRYITLEKNKKWWGNSITNQFEWIYANPNKITYHIIPETLSAIQALKNEEIHVMSDIPSNEFYQMSEDDDFLQGYQLKSPTGFKFYFIAFNTRRQLLNQTELRKAFDYILDKRAIAQVVERSYGELTIGPVSPVLSYYYNSHIEQTDYNPDMSIEILTNLGLLRKEGKWYEPNSSKQIELDVLYSQKPEYEAIALILKSEANKIGIDLNLRSFDSRTLRKKIDDREFDIYISALGGSPFSLDFSPIFSTSASGNGGMNYSGFGNEKSDSLIRAVNYAKDSLDRRQALFELQEMLHKDASMLFLFFTKKKIAISKKFTNLKISSLKPGYDVTAFELAEGYQ